MFKSAIAIPLLVLMIVLSACSKTNESSLLSRNDGTSFDADVISLNYSGEEFNDIVFVEETNGGYLFVVVRNGDSTVISSIDKQGNSKSTVSGDYSGTACFCVRDDALIVCDRGELFSYDCRDLSCRSIGVSVGYDAYYLKWYGEKLFVITTQELIVYSDDYVPLYSIPVGFETVYYCPFWVEGEDIYLTEDTYPFIGFYGVNKDRNPEKVCSSEQFNILFSDVYGEYAIQADMLVRLDVAKQRLVQVADFNNLLMPPPRFSLSCVERYFVSNDDLFYKTYSYNNGTYDIVRLCHNGKNNYNNREMIHIAGYGASDDPYLLNAVYDFNCSQDSFFAVIEDYNDNYPYSDAEDANQQKTRIISRYASEGMPDILYGNDNDYQYMGRNGTVIDISDHLNNSKDFNFSDSIKSIMSKDGKCYNIFAAYTLMGFWGKTSIWNCSDVDYDTANTISREHGKPLYCQKYNYDLFDMALRYETEKFAEDKTIIDEKVIEPLIDYSREQGISINDSKTQFDTYTGLANEEYLLGFFEISNPIAMCEMYKGVGQKVDFIGFPSIYGSCHVIVPQCSLAITASASYPDACWELISKVLSIETQRLSASFGQFPVDGGILNEYIQNTMTGSYSEDLDDYYRIQRTGGYNTPYKDWVLQTISKADTAATYDWGIFNIFYEEFVGMDISNKDVATVGKSITSRYNLYMEENYGTG